MLTIPAYAKINLILEVLGNRADGYREVSTILQTIDLSDTLSFELSDKLDLICDIPDLLPSQNSILQAAELLREEMGCKMGASIYVQKLIPLSGGVGGHSTNAAATLRGLNELWGLGLTTEKLSTLASRISSDTAFFIYNGTALGRGRGERVAPLPPLPETWLVLLIPRITPVHNKTAKVCATLSPSCFTSGGLTQRFIEHLSQGHPDLTSLLFNVFETVAFDFFPQLSWYCSQMLEAGAATVHLAGAGPTLFTLAPNRASGEPIYRRLKEQGHETYLIRTVTAQTSLSHQE